MSSVETWFADYQSELKPVMQKVRESILMADPRIFEFIKWKTPTFEFLGPMASFNPRSKAHVSLLFHQGADIPGRHPALEGTAAKARTMRFANIDDVASKAAELTAITRAWCDWRALSKG